MRIFLRKLLALCACALAVLPAVDAAHAGTVTAQVAGVAAWDSNLFRLPASIADTLPHRGADSFRIVQPSLSIADDTGPVTYSASATVSKAWFQRNSFLNNVSYDLDGQASYTGERNQLKFKGSTLRRLTSFEDLRGRFKSVQRLSDVRAEASQSFAGYVRLVGTASLSQSTNSAPSLALGDYRRAGGSLGLGYYSPTGNILSVQGEILRSDGLNDRATVIGTLPLTYRADYTDRTLFARLFYQPSALVSIDGRLGYTWHKDRSGVAGSFSGITGNVTAQWSPLRSVNVTLAAIRQFASNSGVFSNGIRESELKATVVAQATDRLSFSLSADRRWRQFRYDISVTSPLAAHRERISDATAAVSYRPLRPLTLSASFSRDTRASEVEFFRYKANVGMLTAALAFGGTPPLAQQQVRP